MHFQDFLLVLPVLLFSVIAHEIAHGYAALKQGDDTALMLGRLTWNPIKHIDPVLTILMPLVLWFVGAPILGGAKPVPVNPRKYRNFKRGDIIVSLAGVFTNFLLSIACACAFVLFGFLGHRIDSLVVSFSILQAMMIIGVELNLFLILFNLIPVPPLDGSHVMKYLMPAKWGFWYMQASRAGFAILVAVMYMAPGALDWWLTPAMWATGRMIYMANALLLPGTMGWMPNG